MVSQEEIQEILAGVIRESEKLYTIKDGRIVWTGIPDYYEGYKESVKQKNRIETHAEVDKYPKDLFSKRAPNQNEEENEYVRENYKNTTHPVYMDYLAVTSRGLQDNNWRIKYPEGGSEEEDYNEYITEEIDVFHSIESYVKNIIPSLRGKDANGVITFELKDPSLVEVDGEMVVSDTEKPEPQPKYYSSSQIVAWGWNAYGMFESHEKSLVEYYNKPMKVGRVFYFYDDTNIWRVSQKGKFIDQSFTYEIVYAHELGMFPCHKLKGVPSIKENGSIYYTSRFYYAVDLLDWSLLYSNYLNVSIANVCFPFRWMVGDECDFQEGENACFGGKVGTSDCPSCKGSGMKVRTSPMKTYLLRPKEGASEGDTSFPEPIGFVSPKTDTLEFTSDKAWDYKEQAREILHVKSTNDKATGKDSTATGDLIDLKAMFAFVQPDSDQTFDVFQFLLDVFGKVRTGDPDFKGAKLVYPKTFDFRTDADILEDIKVAREAGAPTHIVNSLMFQYINHRFYAERETAMVSALITQSDRLLTLTNDDIVKRKAQNAVANWEIVLHDSAFQLVNELISETPDFLNLELQLQVEMLEKKAKEKTPIEAGVANAISRADRIIASAGN